jgi:hypothetical protein
VTSPNAIHVRPNPFWIKFTASGSLLQKRSQLIIVDGGIGFREPPKIIDILHSRIAGLESIRSGQFVGNDVLYCCGLDRRFVVN